MKTNMTKNVVASYPTEVSFWPDRGLGSAAYESRPCGHTKILVLAPGFTGPAVYDGSPSPAEGRWSAIRRRHRAAGPDVPSPHLHGHSCIILARGAGVEPAS